MMADLAASHLTHHLLKQIYRDYYFSRLKAQKLRLLYYLT